MPAIVLLGRYRLHPEIVFTKPVTGAAADALAADCPEVFSVADGCVVATAARGNELHLEKVRCNCCSRVRC